VRQQHLQQGWSDTSAGPATLPPPAPTSVTTVSVSVTTGRDGLPCTAPHGMMAQKRYNRLMVQAGQVCPSPGPVLLPSKCTHVALAGALVIEPARACVRAQMTVPAHEQIFRLGAPDKVIGPDRVSAHIPSHAERIQQTRDETVRTRHIGAGPYSDKMNNMYMRCLVPGLLAKDGHFQRPAPRQCHQKALTPWRQDSDWQTWQRTVCPSAQARAKAAKAAAAPDPEAVQLAQWRARMQAESHRSTLLPWRDGSRGPVLQDRATGQPVRAPWRRAGRGVMNEGSRNRGGRDHLPKHGRRAHVREEAAEATQTRTDQ
jgi:hypothetical protein